MFNLTHIMGKTQTEESKMEPISGSTVPNENQTSGRKVEKEDKKKVKSQNSLN